MPTNKKYSAWFLFAYPDPEAFQKIADDASNAAGAAKDLGPVLTRISVRHKNVQSRLESLINALENLQII